MASTNWNVGVSGNWLDSFNWSGGTPDSSVDVSIVAFGTYTVALSGAASANSLTLNASGLTFSEAATGSLTLNSGFFVDAGTAILRGNNSLGTDSFGFGIEVAGGNLEVSGNRALGTNLVGINDATFTAIANTTLNNEFVMVDTVNLVAAHGTTFVENASRWIVEGSTNIIFGSGANDGAIVWHTNASEVDSAGSYAITVAAGILRAGDANFGALFQPNAQTFVDAGAKIDLAGFAGQLSDLQGSGSVTSSNGAPILTDVSGGDFAGVISGGIALDISTGQLTLTGANTYTGNTTIEGAGVLVAGDGGTTGSILGDVSDAGTLNYDRSRTVSITASVLGSGGVGYEGGARYTVNRVESYSGQTNIIGGSTVVTNNAAALGSGTLIMAGGELLTTASITLGISTIDLVHDDTIAAAHGKTLRLVVPLWGVLGNNADVTTVSFGDGANDGTVIWSGASGSVDSDGGPTSVVVQAGTLEAGDGSLAVLLGDVSSVVVNTGATVNFDGATGSLANLSGAGLITSRAGANIVIDGGDFGGVISGATSVDVSGGLILTGANTYSQGTTIEAGVALSLGNGGTTGSVAGAIADNGILIFDRSNTIGEAGVISGTGSVEQVGHGTLVLGGTNTYSGGTFVAGGVLSIAHLAAIGSAALTLDGGELLATSGMQFIGDLTIGGDATIAVATGKSLSIDPAGAWNIDDFTPLTLTFGDGTNDGTVVWHTKQGDFIPQANGFDIAVRSGTLKAGDQFFSVFAGDTGTATVEAAGRIDLAGFSTTFHDLLGSGLIVNSGAATSLVLDAGKFSGQLNGNYGVVVAGNVLLSGSGNFNSDFQLGAGAQLSLANAWAQHIDFAGAARLNLQTPLHFTGVIESFTTGDTIDISGVNFKAAGFQETYTAATQLLKITDGTHSVSLTVDGTYTRANFAPSSDGHGGTDIAFAGTGAAHDLSPPVLASDFHMPVHDWV